MSESRALPTPSSSLRETAVKNISTWVACFCWALSVVPHFSLSPPRVAFSRVGDFHARSLFARSTNPEEKWGTTRSLLVTGDFTLK